MAIIYALIIFIISNYLGKLFIKNDSKLYNIHSVFGFLVLLTILQFGYYFIEFFKLSSNISCFFTLIIMLPMLYLGIITLKKEDFKFLRDYRFYLLLVLIFGIIRILPANEAGDDSFYMPFIMDNSYLNQINTIDPRVGSIGKIDNFYLFQGYYLLLSFFYKIQSFIINSPFDILVSFKTTMSLISVLFASQILSYCKIEKEKINKYVYFIIEILSILLVGVLEWSHVYWGSFMLFPIYIPLYIILFKEYILNNDSKIVPLLLISNAGMISLSSSSLFLILMVTFGFFMYELYNKKANIKSYYIILIPSLIYIGFLFNYLFIIPVAIIGLWIISKLNKYLNEKFNLILFIGFLLLQIIFIILNYNLYHEFNWGMYRLGYSILFFNIAISLFLIYALIKNKKISPELFMFIIINIYFYNPLVSGFVSHFFTTTFVYYRVFYITKNPYMIINIFTFIYEYLKNNKFLLYCFILGLLALPCKYAFNLLNKTFLEEEYYTNYNYYYRETSDSLELGKYLKEKNNSRILSVYFAPRIYNSTIISTTYRYPNDKKYNSDYWISILYKNNNDINDFVKSMDLYNYDYIIVFNDCNTLDNIYNIDFINETYKVYKIK